MRSNNTTIAKLKNRNTPAHTGCKKATSGPIKGFNNDKVFENLDRQVREAWERQTQEAIFVHHMDGGYNPNIAQNVHTIAEDLKGKQTPIAVAEKGTHKSDKASTPIPTEEP